MPVPDKATIEPAFLTSRFDDDSSEDIPANSDYERLVAELRSAGVDVFDPAATSPDSDEPRFLRQDTHWTPEWMEAVARGLAVHLKSQVAALETHTLSWTVQGSNVSRVGDIVDMLKLPAGQRLYPAETVAVNRVLNARDGSPWQANEQAEVLVLGDSFSNIYCTPDLGWGESAGLPAQLARFLERDVDVLARNGAGASATRRELAPERAA